MVKAPSERIRKRSKHLVFDLCVVRRDNLDAHALEANDAIGAQFVLGFLSKTRTNQVIVELSIGDLDLVADAARIDQLLPEVLLCCMRPAKSP